MKRTILRFILILIFTGVTSIVLAAPTTPHPVSNRVVVKFKANNLPKGLSAIAIYAQLREPLTAQTINQLQTAADLPMNEVHSISDGAHVLAVAGQPTRQMLETAIARIRSLPNVEYAEEDVIGTLAAVPNDLYYTFGPTTNPGLWGLWPVSTVATPAPGATGSYGADFQAAWNNVSGNGVVVAVVDTGITPNVDIVGPNGTVAAGEGSNLKSTGYDFITDCRVRGTCAPTTPIGNVFVVPSPNATDTGDFLTLADTTSPLSLFYDWPIQNSSWHGTHVTGIIAALGNNATGVIGGAYTAKIVPVRVAGKGSAGYLTDVAEGIRWAAGVHPTIANPTPAKVINVSLRFPNACQATFQNAINAAVGAGAVVVVAAGNDNSDIAYVQPASCANVISVAAHARDGSRAAYSNVSSPPSNTTNAINVTLAAAGGDQVSYPASFDPGILSTINTGTTTPVLTGGSTYDYKVGTSMATPHVSAAAALMLARNPALSPAEIKTILSAPSSLTTFPSFAASSLYVSPIRDCALNNNCGAGILDTNLAVLNSTPSVAAPAASDFGSVVVDGSSSRTITLTNTTALISAHLGVATITGNDLARFSIGTDSCSGYAIALNGSCQIMMNYAPTTYGSHTATLTVPVIGAETPVLVSLTGTTMMRLTTSDVTAPTVDVGQSTTVEVRFTNPNATSVTTGAISLSQPSMMATSVDNCSNMLLAAGVSCTAIITITPTRSGSYSGTASLALTLAGPPAVATISGTATSSTSTSGGGGCSVTPTRTRPDASLMLAMLAISGYWLQRRIVHRRNTT